jgi:hypothetical protein
LQVVVEQVQVLERLVLVAVEPQQVAQIIGVFLVALLAV